MQRLKYSTRAMDIDEHGFKSDSEMRKQTPPKPGVQAELSKILDKYAEKDIRRCAKLESLVLKGIPAFLRRRTYSALVYERYDVDYEALKHAECRYEYQIDVDIQRTFRNHVMYKDQYGPGQCRLFHVLVAFANYMPAIGYCQGMSNIAGLILMYFPEEEGFFVLANIIKKNNLEALFDRNLSKMKCVMECQDTVFRECIPAIYEYLAGQCIDLSICTYSWYLTLFTRFNMYLAVRIWDVFMFHGFSSLIYVAASLLCYFKKRIFGIRGECLIKFLGSIERADVDPDKLMKILKRYIVWADMEAIKRKLGAGSSISGFKTINSKERWLIALYIILTLTLINLESLFILKFPALTENVRKSSKVFWQRIDNNQRAMLEENFGCCGFDAENREKRCDGMKQCANMFYKVARGFRNIGERVLILLIFSESLSVGLLCLLRLRK
ncbi:UNVERIFIED_CONTAM: hypothetical protein PYX00_011784 [Menopon gallinae]|uniref:Rab-GAP TBC domain-containing protein n=1 Tax=Menopon gallinae TaxID=328185 RepID=A0AAW2H8P1_9NEOP